MQFLFVFTENSQDFITFTRRAIPIKWIWKEKIKWNCRVIFAKSNTFKALHFRSILYWTSTMYAHLSINLLFFPFFLLPFIAWLAIQNIPFNVYRCGQLMQIIHLIMIIGIERRKKNLLYKIGEKNLRTAKTIFANKTHSLINLHIPNAFQAKSTDARSISLQIKATDERFLIVSVEKKCIHTDSNALDHIINKIKHENNSKKSNQLNMMLSQLPNTTNLW